MPVDFKDYYKVLEVERSADAAAIKRAFRAKARKLHPDVNRDDPQAEERFKDLNEAFEVLSDPKKREMYDTFGANWQSYRDAGYRSGGAGGAGSPTGSSASRGPSSRPRTQADDFETWFRSQSAQQQGSSFEYEFVDGTDGSGGTGRFSDFFGMLFGNQPGNRTRSTDPGRMRSTTNSRGEDVEVAVDVSLRESATGTTRHVALQLPVPCTTCGGTGIARGAMCPTCDGSGFTSTSKTLEVTIPKGVRTGSRVRMAGQGAPGINSKANGDVYLLIKVTDEPGFRRDGNNLHTRASISLYTAILGGEATIPTLFGRVAMTIPEGTEEGRVFRLRGKGMPVLNGKPGEAGDLLVEVHLTLPTDLSAEERELFTQLKNLRQ